VWLLTVSSSTFMNEKDIEPIHAATAMETATTTAISIIAAITGLNALLFFKGLSNL
jgi:hypothetical protein